MSPKNDCFMSGALDHTVRLWDLRTNVCQVVVLPYAPFFLSLLLFLLPFHIPLGAWEF
jgi:WD40 repeat protein